MIALHKVSFIVFANVCCLPRAMKSEASTSRVRVAAASAAIAALAGRLVPGSEEPCDDQGIQHEGVLVCDGETTGISHEKLPPLALDLGFPPLAFDFEAAVRANLEEKAIQDKAVQDMGHQMQEALARYCSQAKIDHETPMDGSCLFHALKAGGLFAQRDLGDIQISVSDLRKLAVNEATEEQINVAALSAGTGMTPDAYREGMRRGQWGDNLMLVCLAKVFNRPITVISRESARTFHAGGEFDGTMDEAVWIAHFAELHYFGGGKWGRFGKGAWGRR